MKKDKWPDEYGPAEYYFVAGLLLTSIIGGCFLIVYYLFHVLEG